MAQFSYKGEEFPYSPKEIHLSAAKRLGRLREGLRLFLEEEGVAL